MVRYNAKAGGAKPVRAGRNLTAFEMARWRAYFEGLIDERLEAERARLGQVMMEQNDVRTEAIGELLAELRYDFERALDDLRREIAKVAAISSGEVAELPNVIDLPNPLPKRA